MSKTLRAISLFAGGGGLDLGMTGAGIRVVAASDLEEYACSTLRKNFPTALVLGPPAHDGDIRNYSPELFLEVASVKSKDVDIITGGPPCQPFSIAANQRFLKRDARFKRKGYSDKAKGGLLETFLSFVAAVRPPCFLLENVPGIVEIDGGSRLNKLLAIVHSAGYKTTAPTIIDSVNFGLPQRRRRCFILGLRGRRPPPLPRGSGEILGMPRFPATAVAHALLGIPRNCPNHVCRNHDSASIARYRRLTFGQREHLGRVDRLDPRIPSKTIISGGTNGGGRSHLHPFIARTLTVRESARLQTFPDTYVFSGSIARQFTQVGNAVPPFLAAQLFFFILTQVFGVKVDPPSLPPYLNRRESVEDLCIALWQEAKATTPHWIYKDSLDAYPGFDDLFLQARFANARLPVQKRTQQADGSYPLQEYQT